VLRARWHEGTLTTEVALGEGAPKVEAPNLREVAVLEVTDDEISRNAHVCLAVEAPGEKDVPSADREVLDAHLGELGCTAAQWLDLTLTKRVGGEGEQPSAIHETQLPLKLNVEVPEGMRNHDANVTRTFYLLRAHDGAVDVIASGTDSALSGTTDRFSTYLLAYRDDTASGTPSNPGTPNQPGGGNYATPTRQAPSTVTSNLPRTGDDTARAAVAALLATAAVLFSAARALRRRDANDKR
jgi:hypothetical protein